ncbi:MAG TPA: homoserine dehydrogenase [Chthonomonadaceae bacterium]|nr:homoserine dehydrogenase [Chthonomonadaceae bacterium]
MSYYPSKPWDKDRIEIGILGLGVVGSGTVELLQRNRAEIERKIGLPLHIKRIAVRDLHKKRTVAVDREILTTNACEILDDPDIDIVCELIGGVDPAKEFVLRALKNGKQVVTANKEMIAKEGHELMEEAARRRLDFQFEGSVAGGIPIIQPMKNALSGNRVQEVLGIINGTTNYILTKMTQERADFHTVLKEAQAHGYAEADPTSDIEGYDAQYKIAILASIAFTSRVHVSDVYVEGITRIAAEDIEYADELGYIIKLVGVAKRVGHDRMQVRVHPALLPKSHPLAATNDVYNAVLVKGDSVGDVMFYGRGAGSGPTGSAVVGDIMDVCRNLRSGSTGRVACTCFEQKVMQPIEEVETPHYIRMVVEDKPRVLAAISSVFGDCDINIEAMIQKATRGEHTDIIWLMHETPGRSIARALEIIARLPVVVSISNWLRVEE